MKSKLLSRSASAVALMALALAQGFASASAFAQEAPLPKPLTEAEVRTKYQNCARGYYSGPRPGKARYTKDNFLWVVTPKFAADFCMPSEFVSDELKGAEAVAFRIVEDMDEERCGWGGRESVCGRAKELRFEIYYRNGAVPKRSEAAEWYRGVRSSKMLIAMQQPEWDAAKRQAQAKRLGGIFHESPFSSQFGLVGVQGEKVVWPIVSLHLESYFEEIFEGIDYVSVQGSTGFFTNPRMEKLGVKKFVIAVRRPDDRYHTNDQRPLNGFAHVIELPEAFTEKVRLADKTRGTNIEALGRAAFGLPPAPEVSQSK